MAKPITPRPIAPTPTLTGKDAKRFLAALEANKHKKISQEELDAIEENAQKLWAILKK